MIRFLLLALGLFLLLCFGQPVEYFNRFPCLFRLVAANIIHLDLTAIRPDIGRNDMNVLVAGVLMLVHQVGLLAETDHLHVDICNGLQLLLVELVGVRKVQTDMYAVGSDSFVKRGLMLQAVQLIVKTQLIQVLWIAHGVDTFGLFAFNFLLVVVEGAGEVYPFLCAQPYICKLIDPAFDFFDVPKYRLDMNLVRDDPG